MSPQTDHSHAGFLTEGDPQAHEPYDAAALSRFIGASYDGCQPCQQELIPPVAADAVAVARLVEVSGLMVQEHLGGVPASMYDDRDTPSGPGLSGPEFRELLKAAVTDPSRESVIAAARAMTDEQRTAALNDAADLVVGYMSTAPTR